MIPFPYVGPSMVPEAPGPEDGEEGRVCAWEPCTNVIAPAFFFCSHTHQQSWYLQQNGESAA